MVPKSPTLLRSGYGTESSSSSGCRTRSAVKVEYISPVPFICGQNVQVKTNFPWVAWSLCNLLLYFIIRVQIYNANILKDQ
ncbi:hypothetical protein SRHO_G00046500 [Serrasalmus rhombeus]